MRQCAVIILLSLFGLSIKAQHAYFSSLNQNLLSVNPAFAGTNKQLRAQVISGSIGLPQYGGRNIQSYYAGFDFLGKKYSGFGLSFNTSYSGEVLRKMQADFSYALHFTLKNKIKIIHAYQISYFEYKYDRTKLNFGEYSKDPNDVYDNGWYGIAGGIYTKRNVDISSGLLIYGDRFYFGVSVLSLTQPDEGFLGVSSRRTTQIYQGKFKFLNSEKFNIDAYGFMKLQKLREWHRNCDNFIQYGTYLNYKMLALHIAHRINDLSDYDAFIIGAAIKLRGFRIGYNSKCNYATHLSNYFFNELYLQYSFGRNKKDSEETPDNTIKLID